MKKYFLLLVTCAIVIFSCQNELSELTADEEGTVEIPETFPLQNLEFSSINEMPENWILAERISLINLDDTEFKVEGKGEILVNKKVGDHMILDLDHADIELEVDFMVPKGSNSGLYFQGRYEVQILDSWKNEVLTTADVGSIYPDFDEEANLPSNGSIPSVNASKAPGLWQKLRVVFRAPKFGKDGKKIANARFEEVYLNGYKIQDDVEVPKPTRSAMAFDEVGRGPLMIQGDHGPVAFQNLSYKKIGYDTISVSEINYKFYTGQKFNAIPDFTNLTPSSEGIASSFENLQDLVDQREHFAIVFNGNIDIPATGEYLFTTYYDDGGDFLIDNELVVHYGPKDYESQRRRGLVTLTEGQHQFSLSYYQEVWGSSIRLWAEGPEIPRHSIGSLSQNRRSPRSKNELLINPGSEPEILRGYVNYKEEKRTHVLSVGDATGINYSYDLQEGALLNIWRGGFADVGNMWVGRGASQLLLPRNAVTSLTAGIPIAELKKETAAWPVLRFSKFQNRGYSIDASGYPEFKYKYGDLEITDVVNSSMSGNLNRTISFQSKEATKKHYYRIASEDVISKMSNGSFNVGGQYYIKAVQSGKWQIRKSQGQDELIVLVENGSTLSYEIIW